MMATNSRSLPSFTFHELKMGKVQLMSNCNFILSLVND